MKRFWKKSNKKAVKRNSKQYYVQPWIIWLLNRSSRTSTPWLTPVRPLHGVLRPQTRISLFCGSSRPSHRMKYTFSFYPHRVFLYFLFFFISVLLSVHFGLCGSLFVIRSVREAGKVCSELNRFKIWSLILSGPHSRGGSGQSPLSFDLEICLSLALSYYDETVFVTKKRRCLESDRA